MRHLTLCKSGLRKSPLRGQVWSMDFVASVTVFFLVLTVLFFTWEYTTFQNTDQMIFNEMENKALMLSDPLIRTRGLPEYWNDSNVEILGLASEENVLNESKLLILVGMDYGNVKSLLGISSYNCDQDTGMFCGLAGISIGMLTGMLAAIFIDDVVFGFRPATASTESRMPARPTVQPTLLISPSGTSFGILGAF